MLLAGHTVRHDDPAGKVLLWSPEKKKRRGRPRFALKTLIEKVTGQFNPTCPCEKSRKPIKTMKSRHMTKILCQLKK